MRSSAVPDGDFLHLPVDWSIASSYDSGSGTVVLQEVVMVPLHTSSSSPTVTTSSPSTVLVEHRQPGMSVVTHEWEKPNQPRRQPTALCKTPVAKL